MSRDAPSLDELYGPGAEEADTLADAAKEEWIARCAKRYEERGGMTPEQAKEAAEASLENLGYDLTENPEDAADEDMTCWQD